MKNREEGEKNDIANWILWIKQVMTKRDHTNTNLDIWQCPNLNMILAYFIVVFGGVISQATHMQSMALIHCLVVEK